MKSARKFAYIQRKKKKSRLFPALLPIIFILGFFAVLFIFIKLNTHFWNGKDKVAFAYREKNGDVGVVVLDPVLSDVTNFNIPGDTQINVAENYGVMRIRNVWQLGINEKKTGRLLPETVMENFSFPMTRFADYNGISISQGNFSGVLSFVFKPGATNIAFGDRLLMGLFAIKASDLNRTSIDLGKSQFLRKAKLSDGNPGYIISGPISERLTVYFSNNYFSSKNLKFFIVDSTGEAGVAGNVGSILEVMGGKVVSIDRRVDKGNFDCLVLGNDKKIIETIDNLFSCKTSNEKTNFDLELRLGANFAQRF